MIHTIKDFSLVNEAEVDFFFFLLFPCFFYDPADVGNLISGSSAFFKYTLNIWKFMVHILHKPSWRILRITLLSKWNECSCVVVWTFLDIAFLWNWNENWPFLVLWPLLHFQSLLTYWVQHFNSIIFRIFNSLAILCCIEK